VFAEEYATKPGDRITLVNTNQDKGGDCSTIWRSGCRTAISLR
jgi:hypothetical protein